MPFRDGQQIYEFLILEWIPRDMRGVFCTQAYSVSLRRQIIIPT